MSVEKMLEIEKELKAATEGLAWHLAKEIWEEWRGPGGKIPAGQDASAGKLQRMIDNWIVNRASERAAEME